MGSSRTRTTRNRSQPAPRHTRVCKGKSEAIDTKAAACKIFAGQATEASRSMSGIIATNPRSLLREKPGRQRHARLFSASSAIPLSRQPRMLREQFAAHQDQGGQGWPIRMATGPAQRSRTVQHGPRETRAAPYRLGTSTCSPPRAKNPGAELEKL